MYPFHFNDVFNFNFIGFESVFLHIRGGGELGDKWHLKPYEADISFADLIAGVEYLKGETYADVIDATKIAFYGTSHGGLVGAVAMNKRQDLFRSAVLLNGNMDIITDLPHKGRNWAKQYGNLSNKDDFDCISRYAPLLHIQESTNSDEAYPTTLLVASRNDEAVSITNSLKYLAHRRAQADQNVFQKDKPTFLKVLNSGGHNYRTAAKSEYIDTVFAKLKFLAEAMELKVDKKYELVQICTSFVQAMTCLFPEPEPLVQYPIIEQREPKVMTFHREKVKKKHPKSKAKTVFEENIFRFQQIYDHYDWLKEKCHWNEIFQLESVALQNYFELNSQRNNWHDVKAVFHNAMDYEIYRDVQLINGYTYYSYMNFGKSIFKP